MGTADSASPARSVLERASASFVKGGFAKMSLAASKPWGVFNAGSPIGIKYSWAPSTTRRHHNLPGERRQTEVKGRHFPGRKAPDSGWAPISGGKDANQRRRTPGLRGLMASAQFSLRASVPWRRLPPFRQLATVLRHRVALTLSEDQAELAEVLEEAGHRPLRNI